MYAVETIDVWKRFATQQVLRGFSLRVSPGDVYGLLGPNGAGKSTLIHLLLGFLHPDKGRIAVLGRPPAVAQGRLGYLPEHARYHTHFTAAEYLQAAGACSGLHGPALRDRGRTLLALVGLAQDADRRVGGFSKGMLQRLGVALALVHEPELLLFDEPTSGLDPSGQNEMSDLLTELRSQRHTIVLCSHQLLEVEAHCDRVGILADGVLAAEMRVSDLQARRVTIVVDREGLPAPAAAGLRTLATDVVVEGREIRVADADASLQQALRVLLDAGVSVREVRPAIGGLAELYLAVMQARALPGGRLPAVVSDCVAPTETAGEGQR